MNIQPIAQSGTVGRGHFIRSNAQTASQSTGRYNPSPADFIKSFYAVLNRWRSETAFISDPNQITSHPSYSALVKNAKLVAPLIVGELKREPSFLVWVLDDVFDVRPYKDEDVGNIAAMTDAWIAWAERDGQNF